MKKLLLTTTAILLVSVSFISCKKDKEEIPAQQEQPTTLNQGNGIVETIQNQKDGTSIVFSNWITKTPVSWTAAGTAMKKTDFRTSSLTEEIRNNGLVLVYIELNGFVYQLPYSAYNFLYDYKFIVGKITAQVTNLSGAPFVISDDIRYRYILISPAAFGSNQGGRSGNGVDYSDYDVVCKYYGIAK